LPAGRRLPFVFFFWIQGVARPSYANVRLGQTLFALGLPLDGWNVLFASALEGFFPPLTMLQWPPALPHSRIFITYLVFQAFPSRFLLATPSLLVAFDFCLRFCAFPSLLYSSPSGRSSAFFGSRALEDCRRNRGSSAANFLIAETSCSPNSPSGSPRFSPPPLFLVFLTWLPEVCLVFFFLC